MGPRMIDRGYPGTKKLGPNLRNGTTLTKATIERGKSHMKHSGKLIRYAEQALSTLVGLVTEA